MPWEITQIMTLQERTPPCPSCGARLGVTNIAQNLYLCGCATVFRAVWTNPPKKVKSDEGNRASLGSGTDHS
jgi:ribosomal protein L37AE/L43A